MPKYNLKKVEDGQTIYFFYAWLERGKILGILMSRGIVQGSARLTGLREPGLRATFDFIVKKVYLVQGEYKNIINPSDRDEAYFKDVYANPQDLKKGVIEMMLGN